MLSKYIAYLSRSWTGREFQITPRLYNERSSPMKIAFCISGHLRNYKILKPNFLAFKKYCMQFGEISTFIATWDKINTSNSWSNRQGLNFNLDGSENVLTNLEEIKDHYETNDVLILEDDFYMSDFSPFKLDTLSNKQFNWNPRAISSNGILYCVRQFFLVYQANLLKLKSEYQMNNEYDLVFRIRPDFAFNDLLFSCQFNNIEKRVVYSPWQDNVPNNEIILKDQFAFGDSYGMNIYANVLYRICEQFNKEIFGDPEKLFTYCIRNFNLKIVPTNQLGGIVSENPNSPMPIR